MAGLRGGLCGQDVPVFDQHFVFQYFDFAAVAQEFEEDFDALPCGKDLGDDCFQALEYAGGDDDFVAGVDVQGFDLVLAVADVEADFVDGGIGDDGGEKAETDDAADSLGGGDEFLVPVEVAAREDVSREEGLAEPDLAATGHFFKSEPRGIDFDSLDEADVGGGDVLALLLGAEAEPGRSREQGAGSGEGFRGRQ